MEHELDNLPRRRSRSECDLREMLVARIEDCYTRATDWIDFHQKVLGPQGLVRQAYPDPKDLAVFESTEEYRRIEGMVATLRGDSGEPGGREEPTQVLTIRLPVSLHRALKDEAHQHRTSVNKWCITKLLQDLDLSEAAASSPHPQRRAPRTA